MGKDKVESRTGAVPRTAGDLPRVPGNDYATSWSSSWTDPRFGAFTAKELDLLEHVNCSYLSSGTPPTLLALKQHAQSLTNLIRKLSISTTFGVVNAISDYPDAELEFQEDEAFDWLNNLDEPYKNDDEAHHLPLRALVNNVKREHEVHGPEYHCPLEHGRMLGKSGPIDAGRPWATHQNLVMHANECLEILDHEYSATGGLMSLLPTDEEHESEQLAGARNTILGQWLLHHQHLVARMHELELNYAKAVDLLAGEAIVPAQRLGQTDAERREGREIAFPQDRFILANAGDDVCGFLHGQFDKAELGLNFEEGVWKNSGVSSKASWRVNRAGNDFSRGIVAVEFKSRFYRLRGHGHKSTIFVLPVVDKHPGVAATREAEKRPAVLTTLTTAWPERVTELEKKYKHNATRLEQAENLNDTLMKDLVQLKEVADGWAAEARRARELNRHYGVDQEESVSTNEDIYGGSDVPE